MLHALLFTSTLRTGCVGAYWTEIDLIMLPHRVQRARPRRWVLPFNRELTLGALAQAPLIPWRWKMDWTHDWLKRHFYVPAGLVHMMPGGGNKAAPHDNDYAGALMSHLRPGRHPSMLQCPSQDSMLRRGTPQRGSSMVCILPVRHVCWVQVVVYSAR